VVSKKGWEYVQTNRARMTGLAEPTSKLGKRT